MASSTLIKKHYWKKKKHTKSTRFVHLLIHLRYAVYCIQYVVYSTKLIFCSEGTQYFERGDYNCKWFYRYNRDTASLP